MQPIRLYRTGQWHYQIGIASGFAVTVFFVLVTVAVAAQKDEARLSQVIHDVRLLPSKAAPRPASVNEMVRGGTAVRTGSDSRAELTFSDQTLTRLGENTVFNFAAGAQNLDLTSGAVLLCVPRQSGAVHINTPAVSAAISGGIAMAEFHRKSWTKIIVIEGRGIVILKSTGQTVTLLPGQLITLPPGAKKFTTIQNVDLDKLTGNSVLIRFAKLPSWVWKEIQAEISTQRSAPPPPAGYRDVTGFDAIDQRAATRPASGPKERPP